MAIIVCISDYWHNCTYLQLENDKKAVALSGKPYHPSRGNGQPRTLRRLFLMIDGISMFHLLREIWQFPEFYRRLCMNPGLRQLELLSLQIVPPKKEIIDYKWSRMLAYIVWEKIEVDYLMSWLSTLGGGFSALGEQFGRCAETAGKISLRQLSIGMRMGDPFLQSRCKLYYSISLIQTGRLRYAKYIVRQQYRFAKQHKEVDGRLVKMCKGIWMRIRYEYGLRILERERQKLLGAGDNR